MDAEDGIPRSMSRKPPSTTATSALLRTNSADSNQNQRLKSTLKKPVVNQRTLYPISSRSCDDLNKYQQQSELTVPVCNSTLKIIDQMENLRFEQFEPVLTTTHVDKINEKVNKKLNYSNEKIYSGLIDLEPNINELVTMAEQQELQKRKQAMKFLEEYQLLQKKRLKPDIMELFDETTMVKQPERINLKPMKINRTKSKQATNFSLTKLNRSQTLWRV
ncbi:unnamed protein product [Didymodactylos carnosus]|uniref:Uncharacterized protein n=1 Tax=Didymodactylos carnosus TaxID=1234261 RepID=A0A8S2DKT5_9BILA|nr:unnamed protein product [Didymodactylos carnosus]CAF3699200.1 unnamed protein product [Didymodactylos carnosus]